MINVLLEAPLIFHSYAFGEHVEGCKLQKFGCPNSAESYGRSVGS